jgi:4-hydroxy-tetrahydrodipicolinate reductase
MKIGLVGYGRMGKEIEKIALERGHSVPMIIDVDNSDDFTPENLAKCDVVIEFTVPSSAVNNYLKCFKSGVPVVSGTTGWLHEKEMIYETCLKNQGVKPETEPFDGALFRLSGGYPRNTPRHETRCPQWYSHHPG